VVGVYSGATSLIESVWLISGSVAPIILTHVANSKQNDENKHIAFVLAKLCFLLSCLCVAVLYFIPNDFFVFILGKDFIQTKQIMLLLSPGIVCVSFASIVVHYFSGIGNQKIIAYANICGFSITIGLGYFFVKHYNVLGACYVTSISYFVTSFILLISFMKTNKFGVKDLFELRKNIYLIKKNG
jgi:O-antigen/teichoic acid export membrane protein